MPLGRPRAVLFDLFETLVSVRPDPVRETYTWHELGISREAWLREHFADHAGRAVGKVRDPIESLRLVAHAIDPTIPMDRIERAALMRVERFANALEEPEPRIVDAVERVRRTGARVALVSNALFEEVEAWPRSPLAQHFDAAVFSCDVGIAKPERGIYEAALSRIDIPARDAVFVGDGDSDEHRGARAVGLTPILVTRFAAHRGEQIVERRRPVDHEFDDVVAFADHLVADGASRT